MVEASPVLDAARLFWNSGGAEVQRPGIDGSGLQ
jgi:hypothetical protein